MLRRELLLDLGLLALLTLVVLAFFYPLFVSERWIPRGGGDLVSFLWPIYRFAARSLRAGVIPLWNPHLYGGAPFVADNQSSLFYPVNLLVFTLFGEPSYGVMEALVIFHIWLAGASMFALARVWGLRRSAALLGGIAFALSDLFVTHIGNLNLNATAAWLPMLLLLTQRAWDAGSFHWAAGAGAVLAAAALAGHAQMLLFLALAFLLFLLYRLTADWRRGWRRQGRTLALAAFIIGVGVGGAMLTLLPAYEMAAHTGRGHLPYAEATRYSLPPRALIGLLAPGFYGRGPAGFWASWDRVEVGYVGVAALVLAVVGYGAGGCYWIMRLKSRLWRSNLPFDWPERRSRFPFGFFAILVPLAFILAMGRYTPFYKWLYRYAPTFDQVRAPARLILLADLGLAALAAYGLDWLSRIRMRWKNLGAWVGLATVAAGGIFLSVGLPWAREAVPPQRLLQAERAIVTAAVLLGLTGACVWLIRRSGRRRWMSWLFPLLLVVDLIGLGAGLEIEPHDPTVGFRHADIADFLRQDTDLFRVEAAAGAWQPDAAMEYGLYDIGGVYNPLELAPYRAYRWAAVGERDASLYNLMGVKYVLADKGALSDDEGLELLYTKNRQIDVYLNPNALPRAFMVHRSQIVADHTAAWQAIHTPEFDPAQMVVLEHGTPLAADPGAEKATVSFLRYGLNEIELEACTPVSGFLVLSDVYYPGWRATVDGLPAEVLRADYVFRAVSLLPGEHTVRMVFDPWPWRVGLIVSLITWVCLGLWVIGFCLRCRLALK